MNDVIMPDVAWNGTTWGLVWSQMVRVGSSFVYHPFFQQLAVDGTPIGTANDLSTLIGSSGSSAPVALRIAAAPTTGFAVVYSPGSAGCRFVVLGSGAGPFGAVTSFATTYDVCGSVAGAPDGSFGVVITLNGGMGAFQARHADGSLSGTAASIGWVSDPHLVHDGTTWLASLMVGIPSPNHVVVLRGPTLGSVLSVATPVPDSAPFNAIAVASDRTATVVWNDVSNSSAQGMLHAVRVALPTGIGIVSLATRPTTIMADATAAFGRLAVSAAGGNRFVVAWPDMHFGQSEAFTLLGDAPSCR